MAQADSHDTTNVIKFPFNVSRMAHARKPRASADAPTMAPTEAILDNRPSGGSLSITAANGRLRQERHEIWRMAEAARQYWRARLDFQSAVSYAQQTGVPEGRDHPADPQDRGRQSMVDRWRAALVKQLLTPAPDGASVKWKQAVLDRGELCHTNLKSERLERAIADDLAFLAAHPIRQARRDGAAQS